MSRVLKHNKKAEEAELSSEAGAKIISQFVDAKDFAAAAVCLLAYLLQMPIGKIIKKTVLSAMHVKGDGNGKAQLWLQETPQDDTSDVIHHLAIIKKTVLSAMHVKGDGNGKAQLWLQETPQDDTSDVIHHLASPAKLSADRQKVWLSRKFNGIFDPTRTRTNREDDGELHLQTSQYDKRFDEIVKFILDWEAEGTPLTENGRLGKVLEGSFAAAKNQEVLDALRFVYNDIAPFRIAGDPDNSIASALSCRQQRHERHHVTSAGESTRNYGFKGAFVEHMLS
eukprot:s1223_g7.t1